MLRGALRRLESIAYEFGATAMRLRPAPVAVTVDLAPKVVGAPPGQLVVVTPKGRPPKLPPSALRASHEPLGVWVGEARFVPVLQPSAKNGGLYDSESRLIPVSVLRRGVDRHVVTVALDDLPVAYESSDEPVIFGGLIRRHFGHFLTEVVARLWYALEVRPDLRIAMHCDPLLDEPFIAGYFSALGLPRSRFVRVTHATQYREVHVPEPSWIEGAVIHDEHLRMARRVADGVLGERTPEVRDEPLYLARTRVARGRRPVYGERGLVRALHRSVRVEHPQLLDFAEQIRVINSHRTVVGPIGSAHHLSLFALEPRHHVYLCDAPFTNCILIDAAKGNRAHFLACSRAVSSLRPRSTIIDLNFALSQLRELGVW